MKKSLINRLILPLGGLLMFALQAEAGPAKTSTDDMVLGALPERSKQSLNGYWKYICDPYETGSGGFASFKYDIKPRNKSSRVEYSFDLSPELAVPGDWNSQDPELKRYEGSIWYRRNFVLNDAAKDKRVFLYFGGANYNSKVYINRKHVGNHEGGFTPFNFDVTDFLKEGTNTLVVGVSNTRQRENIPGRVTDWYNYGGLTRDVNLVFVEPTFVRNFRLQLAKGSNDIATGWVQLDGKEFPKNVNVSIDELSINKSFPVDTNGLAKVSMELNDVQLWEPANPKLYHVKVTAGESISSDRIGFRNISTEGADLLLNGKKIFLRGICFHEENALRKSRAWSREDAELLIGWVKEMNCNFIRLAHYPHNEHIVRLAEEEGIMLWSEQPIYWGIDWKNEEVSAKAARMFKELIERDGNRAAVIIWSICNETMISKPRNEFLINLAGHVRGLDNTRLLSAALKPDRQKPESTESGEKVMKFSDPLGEHLDVVAFNEYVGWYNGPVTDCASRRFETKYNKPLIVSEFGGGAQQGLYADKETRWSEEYQEWLYKETLPMLERTPQLAGTTPWILIDFQSPLRHLPNIQDGWNRKGLISDRGIKKKAFYVMQEYYAKKAAEAEAANAESN